MHCTTGCFLLIRQILIYWVCDILPPSSPSLCPRQDLPDTASSVGGSSGRNTTVSSLSSGHIRSSSYQHPLVKREADERATGPQPAAAQSSLPSPSLSEEEITRGAYFRLSLVSSSSYRTSDVRMYLKGQSTVVPKFTFAHLISYYRYSIGLGQCRCTGAILHKSTQASPGRGKQTTGSGDHFPLPSFLFPLSP